MLFFDEENLAFKVRGTTGNIYDIAFGDSMKCTCMDFVLHSNPCKHIFFILGRVGKIKWDVVQNLLIKNETKSLQTILSHCVIILKSMMMVRVNGNGEDCPICLETLEESKDNFFSCPTCKQLLHDTCFEVWQLTSSSCPLCRRLIEIKIYESTSKKLL